MKKLFLSIICLKNEKSSFASLYVTTIICKLRSYNYNQDPISHYGTEISVFIPSEKFHFCAKCE